MKKEKMLGTLQIVFTIVTVTILVIQLAGALLNIGVLPVYTEPLLAVLFLIEGIQFWKKSRIVSIILFLGALNEVRFFISLLTLRR